MMKKLVGNTIAPGSISCRLLCAVSLALAFLVTASSAHARLKIRLVSQGGAPPTDQQMVGGGNLDDIMKVAAGAWEDVFKTGSGMWNVTVNYHWAPIGTGWAWGVARIVTQGGNNPVRITEALLEFNNESEAAQWFADPTPRDSTEYRRYSSHLWTDDRLNPPTLLVNSGRNFTEATGDAEGRIDLLTVAIHEIGHALGFNQDYVGYKCGNIDGLASCGITITAPRPYAGLILPMKRNTSHFADDEFLQVEEAKPLMIQDPVLGMRQFISVIDALAIAEASKFDRPNLDATLPLPW